MLREDEDFVKRTLTVILGVLLLFGIIFWGTIRVHQTDSRTRQAKYAACATIKDETVRRDCISGSHTGQVYAR